MKSERLETKRLYINTELHLMMFPLGIWVITWKSTLYALYSTNKQLSKNGWQMLGARFPTVEMEVKDKQGKKLTWSVW